MRAAMIGYLWLALAIVLETTGQLMFKAGVPPSLQPPESAHLITTRAVNPWIVAGIVAYLLELLAWIAALSSLPLNQAFPVLSLSYASVAIAAWLLFDERIRARAVVGIVLVSAGAALMLA